MNDDKGLTKQAKKDIAEIVDQAFDGFSAKIFAPVFTKLETRFIKIENGIDELMSGQKQQQINDLNMATPTKKEHDDLRDKVDRYHPTN